MKLEKTAALTSRAAIIQILVTAVLYAAMILVVKQGLQVARGVEFRVATFIPVVSGMVFGLPGAIGAGIGNFLVALVLHSSKNSLLLNFFTSVGNFFLAYLPFVLWYGYDGKAASLYVYNARSFRKLIGIMLLTALNFSALVSSAVAYFYRVDIPDTLIITFSNNFLFPIIIGAPLLLLWRQRMGVVFCEVRSDGRHAGYQLPALVALTAFNVIYLAVAANKFVGPFEGGAALAVNIALMAYICTLPSDYTPNKLEMTNYRSLEVDMTMRLFCSADTIVLLLMLGAVLLSGDSITQWRSVKTWRLFYSYLFVAFGVIFFGMYRILRSTGRKFTDRLKIISAAAYDYIEHGTHKEHFFDREIDFNSLVTINEIDVLEHSLNEMNRDIHHYIDDLRSAIREKEAIQAQLDIAAGIQRGVLPRLQEVAAGQTAWAVWATTIPARSVGGDMYDCFWVDDRHLAVMIADVSGKGIPAALFMMVTEALIKNNARLADPAAIVARTNDTLADGNEEVLFVTMWLGVLDLDTWTMRYVNAGHNPPLLWADGRTEWIRPLSGPVLGLMGDMEYESFEFFLPPGAHLLLYTDGLNEAENGKGEFYSNERLEECFSRAASPDEIYDDIQKFVAGAPQSDDLTYLWLERRGE